MSAVLKDAPHLTPMREADLAEVMAIENAIYSHPWTRGNFADSLNAGYECRCLRLGQELLGYFVLMVAAQEAHLLNLSIGPAHQRRGHGSAGSRRSRSAPRRAQRVPRGPSEQQRRAGALYALRLPQDRHAARLLPRALRP